MNSNIYYKSRRNFTATGGRRFSFADNITVSEYLRLPREDQNNFRKMVEGNRPVRFKESEPIKIDRINDDINPPPPMPGDLDFSTPI